MQKFDKIKGKEFTKFELEKTEFALTLPVMDILEFFDLLRLNINIPFISIRNFYKIYEDFVPSILWTISLENVISMKVLNLVENTSEKLVDKNYSNSLVYYDENKDKLIMTIEIITGFNNINKNGIIERIQSIITNKLIIESEEQQYISGVFYFPNAFFNKYVLADLCMNDPLFSILLKIDESNKAYKKKQSVYVHFMSPNEGKIILKANITEKIMERNDPLMKNKSLKIFPIGVRYIRVKVSKANNIDQIHKFINILTKLFDMYDQKQEEIIKFYQKYISNFGKEKFKVVEEGELQLKYQVPDLFLPTYTRLCADPPRITYNKEKKRKEGFK